MSNTNPDVTLLMEEPSFGITADELFNLLNDRNTTKYHEMGKAEGFAKLLKTNLNSGLVLEAHVRTFRKALVAEKGAPSSPGSPKSENDALEKRIRAFGDNFMPEPISKTILGFILDSFQDRTLILLCVAATAEVAIGIYEKISHDDPLALIDGFVVILAGNMSKVNIE